MSLLCNVVYGDNRTAQQSVLKIDWTLLRQRCAASGEEEHLDSKIMPGGAVTVELAMGVSCSAVSHSCKTQASILFLFLRTSRNQGG